MRLRLFDRIRRFVHPRRPETAGTQGRHRRDQRSGSVPGASGAPGESFRSAGPPQTFSRSAALAPDDWPSPGSSVVQDRRPGPARRASGTPAVRVGGGRARVREDPAGAAPAAPGPPPNWYAPADRIQEAAAADARADALARAAAGIPHQAGEAGRSARRAAGPPSRMSLPFVSPHQRERSRTPDGRRHCGSLEAILWRQWDPAMPPPPEVVEAVDRLAELPERIKERLAAGLDAIFVGPGGVPELDEMTALRGVRLPSGQATWDACAGAYGERKIVVGSQPSPTPDVMCHEIGHALDDLDSPPGKWQSDSAEFRILYDQCQPHLASDFHRQPGGLGRKEFFADAFAAIASGQRPALVDMLSGDTRTALRVMLYFNRRYGI
jgi:hypothetical protein